jgi:hypothetical protein
MHLRVHFACARIDCRSTAAGDIARHRHGRLVK